MDSMKIAVEALDRIKRNTMDHNMVRIADEALALLTAEPEPCEDARKIACEIDEIWKVIGDGTGETARECLDIAEKEIAAYASQVADKRAEELQRELGETKIRLSGANTLLEHSFKHIEQMHHMIKLVLKDEKRLSGISKFRLIGLLPPPDEALAATEPKP